MNFWSSRSFWEDVAIVLEIASFLLVTLDLYGEERLKKLTDNILNWTSHGSVFFHEMSKNATVSAEQWIRNKYFRPVMIAAIIMGVVVGGFFAYRSDPKDPWLILTIGTTLGLLAVCRKQEQVRTVAKHQSLSYEIISRISGALLANMAKERAKGWMIVTGVVLFLLKKVIDIWLVNWWHEGP